MPVTDREPPQTVLQAQTQLIFDAAGRLGRLAARLGTAQLH